MPISIIEPSVGGVVGPGLNVHVSTDFPAPLGPDDHWFLSLVDPEDTNTIVGHARKQFTTQVADIVMGTTDGVVHADEVQHPKVADGENVRLVVELINGVDGHVMDSGQAVFVHDRRTGLLGQLQGSTQAAAGFTEEDRVVLMQAQGGILSLLVDVFLEPVVEWLAQYLPQSFTPIVYEPLVCDETILTRPDLAPFNRWIGVRWRVVEYPSGLGIVDGFPDHSYASWGQISLTKLNEDAAAICYDTRYEARLEGEVLWGTNEPYNVQVYVLPGVCVEFSALVAPPWSPQRGR